MSGFERPEERSEARQLLERYERSGRFLFHGSRNPRIQELEPRQAMTWREGAYVNDGPPAVAASPYADIAIFRSLITGHSGFSSFPNPDDTVSLEFRLTRAGYAAAEHARGYVYVISRDGFSPVGPITSMDWRSGDLVTPVDIIEVQAEDLPKNLRFYRTA